MIRTLEQEPGAIVSESALKIDPGHSFIDYLWKLSQENDYAFPIAIDAQVYGERVDRMWEILLLLSIEEHLFKLAERIQSQRNRMQLHTNMRFEKYPTVQVNVLTPAREYSETVAHELNVIASHVYGGVLTKAWFFSYDNKRNEQLTDARVAVYQF